MSPLNVCRWSVRPTMLPSMLRSREEWRISQGVRDARSTVTVELSISIVSGNVYHTRDANFNFNFLIRSRRYIDIFIKYICDVSLIYRRFINYYNYYIENLCFIKYTVFHEFFVNLCFLCDWRKTWFLHLKVIDLHKDVIRLYTGILVRILRSLAINLESF